MPVNQGNVLFAASDVAEPVLARALDALGKLIVETSEPAEAARLIRSPRAFDFVIVDLALLGGTPAPEALKRSLRATAAPPLFFLTSPADTALIARAREFPDAAFLIKGSSAEVYEAVIASTLERRMAWRFFGDTLADALINATTDAVLLVDVEGSILAHNANAANSLSMDGANLIGLTARDLLPPEVADERLSLLRRAIDERRVIDFEDARGDRCFEHRVFPVAGGSGAPDNCAVIYTRDISDRRRTELSAAQAEEHYRVICELTSDYACLVGIDAEGRFTREWSSSEIEDLVGRRTAGNDAMAEWAEMVHPDDLPEFRDKVRRFLYGAPQAHEFRVITSSGEIVWLHGSALPFRESGSGRVNRFYASLTNITERKLLTERLRAGEARFRHLVENNTAIIYSADFRPDYRATFFSDNLRGVLGYDPVESLSDPRFWIDRVHPDDLDYVLAKIDELLRGGYALLEYRFLHRNGEYRWMRDEARLCRDERGEPIEMMGHFSDITKRVELEEGLARGKAMLEGLLNAVTESIILLNPDGVVLAANETTERRLGVATGKLVGSDVFGFFRPEKRDERRRFLDEIVATGRPKSLEIAGEGFHYEIHGYPVRSGKGTVTQVAVFALDATERKRANDLLRDSEARFRQLVEQSADIILIMRRDGVLEYASPSVRSLLGYEPGDFIGENPFHLGNPDDEVKLLEGFATVFDSPGPVRSIDHRLRRKDGSWLHVETSAVLFSGVPDSALIVTHDVSARVVNEKRLQIIKSVLETIITESALSPMLDALARLIREDLEFDTVGIRLVTDDGRMPFAAGVEHYLHPCTENGYLCAAVVRGTLPNDPVHCSPGGSFFVGSISELLSGETAGSYGLSRDDPCVDGFESILMVPLRLERRALGLVHCASRSGRGIAADEVEFMELLASYIALAVERSRSEERLAASEERFRLVAENINDVFWIFDPKNGQTLYVSPAFETIWALPREPLSSIIDKWKDSIHPDELSVLLGAWKEFMDSGSNFTIVYRILRRDGETRWIRSKVFFLHDPDRGLESMIGVSQDITDFKVNEDAMRKSENIQRAAAEENLRLMQRAMRDAETLETLLYEVNHRVKNTLASILGLMLAEVRFMPSEEQEYCRAVFGRLSGQIYGLLEVHSMLSESGWTNPSLDELTSRLLELADKGLPPGKRLAYRVRGGPIAVSPKAAASLCLLLNELIQNSTKHSLHGSTEIGIEVSMEMTGDTATLVFRDDGPGFGDETLKGGRIGAGMYIIERLVESDLRGSLKLENDGGAVWTIRFRPGV